MMPPKQAIREEVALVDALEAHVAHGGDSGAIVMLIEARPEGRAIVCRVLNIDTSVAISGAVALLSIVASEYDAKDDAECRTLAGHLRAVMTMLREAPFVTEVLH